jgi:hypothetical protein
MNERIKELVEKAPYTTVSTEGRLFSQQDLAKFAELIVRDIHAYVDGLDTAQIISNGILKRYGVTV